LKHDADLPAAEARERILAEPAEIMTGHHDGPAIRLLKPGHDHEQRRLAGAGWPGEADRLARTYMQRDVFEDMNACCATPE
jgi:hypothetical protein